MILKKTFFTFTLCTFLTLFLDQMTKWWGRSVGIVIFNDGFSFNLASSYSAYLLGLLTVIVLIGIFFLFHSIWKINLTVFGLLAGAALSNVFDRVFFTGVQDFLPIPFTQLKNNLADWVIFLCLVWVGWKVMGSNREERLDKR